MPIVNTFPLAEELSREKKMPLRLCICRSCSLVQLSPVLANTAIFDQYHYVSGASSPLITHLESLAAVIEKLLRRKRGKVLDIGCNDGTLLLSLQKKGKEVLGIDPAVTVVQLARAKGLPVISDFFTSKSAGNIKKDYGLFDVVVITHTLANIVDLRDFFSGVKKVLAPGGVVIIEVGSLETMLKKGQFDSIYHEHYSYFSEGSIVDVLERNEFVVTKLEKNDFHGGALRVFARKRRVGEHSRLRVGKIPQEQYKLFAESVQQYRNQIQKQFASIKGKRVIGFGAPAKAVTLLNYCGIGKKEIAYIVDSTPYKQGRYLPGVHIPVFAEEYLWQDTPPDYILLLAWNYQKEIVQKLRKRMPGRTKIIIPLPNLQIFSLS